MERTFFFPNIIISVTMFLMIFYPWFRIPVALCVCVWTRFSVTWSSFWILSWKGQLSHAGKRDSILLVHQLILVFFFRFTTQILSINTKCIVRSSAKVLWHDVLSFKDSSLGDCGEISPLFNASSPPIPKVMFRLPPPPRWPLIVSLRNHFWTDRPRSTWKRCTTRGFKIRAQCTKAGMPSSRGPVRMSCLELPTCDHHLRVALFHYHPPRPVERWHHRPIAKLTIISVFRLLLDRIR